MSHLTNSAFLLNNFPNTFGLGLTITWAFNWKALTMINRDLPTFGSVLTSQFFSIKYHLCFGATISGTTSATWLLHATIQCIQLQWYRSFNRHSSPLHYNVGVKRNFIWAWQTQTDRHYWCAKSIVFYTFCWCESKLVIKYVCCTKTTTFWKTCPLFTLRKCAQNCSGAAIFLLLNIYS